jgi:hypothetical protein
MWRLREADYLDLVPPEQRRSTVVPALRHPTSP